MRILLILLAAVVVLIVVAIIAIRSMGHDAARWHVDPLTAPTPSSPNSYRVGPANGEIDVDAVAPIYAVDSDTLGMRFDAMVRSRSRTEVVDGSAADGWVTYVQRSALFGFPDYVSVRFIDLPDVDGVEQSTIAIFSRSRLGESDLGVNEKRVNGWLEALDL